MSPSYPRPGTPFPYTTSLSHSSSSQSSYFSPRPLHFSLPTLPTPTPPSLLNRSSSSSSTLTLSPRQSYNNTKSHKRSTSTPHSTPIPSPELEVDLSRRLSSSSSSTSSTSTSSPTSTSASLPQTPHLVLTTFLPSTIIQGEPSPFELSSPYTLDFPFTSSSSSTESIESKTSKGFSLPEPEYNWTLKSTIDTPIFNPPSSTLTTKVEIEKISKPFTPTRPKSHRRDTPVPSNTTTQNLLTMSRFGKGREGGKRLTSVIDGGAWIVVK